MPTKFKNPHATMTKGYAMFRCEACGKLTRDVSGSGNTYCESCLEEMEQENERQDGRR